jgi:hypothetical protein
MMRVKLSINLLSLLLAFTAAAVVASVEPLHPGDALYPLQLAAERGAAALGFEANAGDASKALSALDEVRHAL